MGEVTTYVSELVHGFYKYFISFLPNWAQNFLGLFLLVLLIVVYAIFIWKFYRFVSKKNIIKLNLKQFNRSENPVLSRTFGVFLYILEYILILPFLIFFWFAIFAIFIIFLTQELPVSTILILSATIIGAIRMTAYYNEEVSREIAKLLPFTLLAVSMTKTNFFDLDRVLNQISQLPSFFDNIITYLLFIVFLEIVLRFFEFIFGLFGLTDLEEELIEDPDEGK
jgi:hypothetical protein